MDNISDILANKNVSEPPEIKIIKDFILKEYDEIVSVKIELNQIIIYVGNSALASNIRMNIPKIQAACNSSKRVAIYLKS
jgi:ribosomal protein L31E